MRRLLANRFLRNTATLQVATMLTSVGNLVSSIALAHVLGAAEQGSYIVAIQLFALAFFLGSLGILQVAVTQIAAACARGQRERVAEWMAFQVKVYLLIGGLLVAVGYFLLPFAASKWHAAHPLVDPDVGWWAWWLSGTVLLDVPRSVATSALQGSRRMLLLAQLENGTEVARVFLVVTGAIVTGDASGAVLGLVATSVVGSLIALEIYRRARRTEGYELPSLREVLARVRSVPIRQGLSAGLRFGAMRQMDAMLQVLPPLVIQSFASSSWVAYFQIAVRIMNLPRMLISGLSRTLLPTLSELRGLADEERFRRTFFRASLMGGSLVAVGILACLPLVPFATGLLYPESYVDPVWRTALILALAFVPTSFALAFDSFYLLTGQINRALAMNACIAVVGIASMVGLSALRPHSGAAWGLAVIHLSAAIVHYAYILSYFHRRRGSRPAVAPAPREPEVLL